MSNFCAYFVRTTVESFHTKIARAVKPVVRCRCLTDYRAMLYRARLCHSKSLSTLSQKSATVAEFRRCLAVLGDSHFSATVWTGHKSPVRLSVCDVQVFHTGWNTSKIISRLSSLRFLLGLAPTSAIWSIGNNIPPKLWWNKGGIMSTKTCNISEMVQDMTEVTMTN